MRISRESYRFLIVGLVSTLFDFVTYFTLANLHFPRDYSKAIAFIFGTWVGYIGNSKFTFREWEHKVFKYASVYSCSFIANVFTNSVVVSVTHKHFLGWTFATAISTMLNFLGLRYFAFYQKV